MSSGGRCTSAAVRRCAWVSVLLVALFGSALVLPSTASAQADSAYLDGSQPWTESDCVGDVPIVVGSDAKAQSDIYSAVTLAGVVDTDCVVLAGPRDGVMLAEQQSRFDAAARGGYVVGGTAAVPRAKLGDRSMTRIGGATRWDTAQLIGNEARAFAGADAADEPDLLDAGLSIPADATVPGVFLSGAEPWIASDCADEIPIVVGSDTKAQSDIYSAVTLAGVIGTTCVVLAGPRDETMPASQQSRLKGADSGGFVVGGSAAVPTAKIAGRDMTRFSGADRWATAQLVGRHASGDTTAGTSTRSEKTGTAPVGTAAFSAVSAAYGHSCGLQVDGAVICWGSNLSTQAEVPPGTYSAVSAAESRSCGLRVDGTLVCWGYPFFGDRSAPPSGTFTAVSAGGSHACGLRIDGSLSCWGLNPDGQPPVFSGVFSVVSAGKDQSCGVQSDGGVTCWGDVLDLLLIGRGRTVPYRLSDGSDATYVSDGTYGRWLYGRSPELDAPSGEFTAVSAGASHACGVRVGGNLSCWGRNRFAQADEPAGRFTAVSAGDEHSCAIRTSGTAICWGRNEQGQAEAPSGAFIAVSAGGRHSCGVRTNGEVICWGDNETGQTVVPSGGFAAVSAGWQNACGLRLDGSVNCWGRPGFKDDHEPSGKFGAVSAGSHHSCGLRLNGSATCWGADGHGSPLRWRAPSGSFTALSDRLSTCGVRDDGEVTCWRVNWPDQTNARLNFGDIPAGPFSAVSNGSSHSCGLRTNGRVTCWGSNVNGRTDAPSGEFTAVSVGNVQSCGLRTNGTVTCWGRNHRAASDAPAGVFSAVSAGGWHTCGLREDGGVTCWGDNDYGETDAPTGKFVAISAGDDATCGILRDGHIQCWGINAVRIW